METAEKTIGGLQDQDKTVMVVAIENPASGLIAVVDKIRHDSADRGTIRQNLFWAFF